MMFSGNSKAQDLSSTQHAGQAIFFLFCEDGQENDTHMYGDAYTQVYLYTYVYGVSWNTE